MNFRQAMRLKHGKIAGGDVNEANDYFAGLDSNRQFTETGKMVSKGGRTRKKVVKFGQRPPRSRYGNL